MQLIRLYAYRVLQRLFSHATDDYDIIIELDPSVLPRYNQNIDADELAWSRGRVGHASDGNGVSRPGFDPARMLFDDLQVRKALFWLFLYNLIGATVDILGYTKVFFRHLRRISYRCNLALERVRNSFIQSSGRFLKHANHGGEIIYVCIRV